MTAAPLSAEPIRLPAACKSGALLLSLASWSVAYLMDSYSSEIYRDDIERIDTLGPNRRLVSTMPNLKDSWGRQRRRQADLACRTPD